MTLRRGIPVGYVTHFVANGKVATGADAWHSSVARDVLAKGCPLDLRPRAFGPGRCAQSHLAKAPILLPQIDAAPTFEIIVRRSFADYLWLWLEDAAESELAQPHRLSLTTPMAGA